MSLTILQLNSADSGGGAGQIAMSLHRQFLAQEHQAQLAVGYQFTHEPGIRRIPVAAPWDAWARGWTAVADWALAHQHLRGVWRLQECARTLALPGNWRALIVGREPMAYPGCRHLLRLAPEHPMVLHLHNLHGGYFDLRLLPRFSQAMPTFLTLHDAWLLSGHCAHSFACERWTSGCGACPDLTIPPTIHRDATAENWLAKQRIYRQSRLYVAAPSHWLMDRIERSMLTPAIVESRVIPNGVDLAGFSPADQSAARIKLGLPLDTRILLFSAAGIRANVWKDYHTLREAVARTAERLQEKRILFLALGEEAAEEQIGRATIRFVPYQRDEQVVAEYYRAADVYIHAARADTFPTVVLEALACGTPVVATAVGGIPEQIVDGVTGLLTPPDDADTMAGALVRLLTDDAQRLKMRTAAREDACQRFNAQRMANDYLAWYTTILARRTCTSTPSPCCPLSNDGAEGADLLSSAPGGYAVGDLTEMRVPHD